MTDIDLVEKVEEKPRWVMIQSLRNKIERREKKIVELGEEIDELWDNVARVLVECDIGDKVEYISDTSKQFYVHDIDPIDYKECLIFLVDVDDDLDNPKNVKTYQQNLFVNNFNVIENNSV